MAIVQKVQQETRLLETQKQKILRHQDERNEEIQFVQQLQSQLEKEQDEFMAKKQAERNEMQKIMAYNKVEKRKAAQQRERERQE